MDPSRLRASLRPGGASPVVFAQHTALARSRHYANENPRDGKGAWLSSPGNYKVLCVPRFTRRGLATGRVLGFGTK